MSIGEIWYTLSDKKIYDKHYAKQDGTIFYIYPLRSENGAKLLEMYFGKFFKADSGLEFFGIKLIANLIRLIYASNYVTAISFESHLNKETVESMSDYQLDLFFEKDIGKW